MQMSTLVSHKIMGLRAAAFVDTLIEEYVYIPTKTGTGEDSGFWNDRDYNLNMTASRKLVASHPVLNKVLPHLSKCLSSFKESISENYETRLHFLRDRFKNINSGHEIDRGTAVHDPDSIIKFWMDKDPTFQQKYSPQVLQWYWNSSETARHLSQTATPAHEANHDFLFQRHGERVHQALGDLNRLHRKMPPEERSITHYNSLQNLENTVAPYLDKETRSKRIAKDKAVIDNGSELIHRSDNLSVRKINDFPAMTVLGKHTRWCTTMGNRVFSQYADKGPLYVINDKGDESTKQQRYIYHPASEKTCVDCDSNLSAGGNCPGCGRHPEALVDEKDHRVSVSSLTKRHPILNKIFQFSPQTESKSAWINELFDKPAPLHTVPPFRKLFNVKGNDYELQVSANSSRSHKKWDVAFGQVKQDKSGYSYKDDKINNAGHAPLVLATVLGGLHDLIKKHQPHEVSFGSREPSRTGVYRHMIKRFAQKAGYDWSEEPVKGYGRWIPGEGQPSQPGQPFQHGRWEEGTPNAWFKLTRKDAPQRLLAKGNPPPKPEPASALRGRTPVPAHAEYNDDYYNNDNYETFDPFSQCANCGTNLIAHICPHCDYYRHGN